MKDMKSFKTKIQNISNWQIVRIPQSISDQFSSRGIVMIQGTINGFRFQTNLEPDGKGSHWFRVDSEMQKKIKVEIGDVVELSIIQVNEWIEPKVPDEFKQELQKNSEAKKTWDDITVMARWEWIRWMQDTKQKETYIKRISKAISMLKSGKRRPCCFNSSKCTVSQISINGVLID